MRILRLVLLTTVVTLGIPAPVSADLSPPLYPPGSAVLPAGQTMVQMVSERVEITIAAGSADAEIAASFSMRNQGSATEQMDVRFPLGPPEAPVTDFVAHVGGRQAIVRETEEPVDLDYPWGSQDIRWAVFPVTFEPGADLLISVTYAVRISGFDWYLTPAPFDDPVADAFFAPMNPDTAAVYYYLETGAGWYGPIESGVILLRLPYETNVANVFDLDAGLAEMSGSWSWGTGEHLVGPSFADNEARWEFSGLEPTREDNLILQFLWPEEWERILDLQAEADLHPEDPMAAVDLAGAYLAAGASVWEWDDPSEVHCSMSQEVIERALVISPGASELTQALELLADWCPNLPAPPGQATATPIPTHAPTFAYPRPPTLDPASVSTALAIAQLPSTAGPELATAAPASAIESEEPPIGIGILVAVGIGVAIVLALAGIRSMRASR